MDEAIAQKIMSEYLERVWNVKLEPKLSGPDFLYKGRAVEVKGSDFKVSNIALQLTKYGAESEELGFAFPVDALDSTNLIHLHSLGTIWYNAFEKYLEVYVIVELEHKYAVLKFSNAADLVYNIFSYIRENSKLNKRELSKLLEDVPTFTKNLDSMIHEALTQIITSREQTVWLDKPIPRL